MLGATIVVAWLALGLAVAAAGVTPDELPQMPPSAEPIGLIKPRRGVPRDGRKIVTKAEREHTPPDLARWLVELARRCARQTEQEAAC